MTTPKSKTEKLEELPPAPEFCLAVPLFERFLYNADAPNPFFALEHFKGTLDCHCHGCGNHSVFNRAGDPRYSEHHHKFNYLFVLWFHCSRNTSHRLCFLFHTNDGYIQKIGQFPSLADIALPDIQKYRNVLGPERFKELSRAVGLAAHGIGIGAFVYLRRIFESLVDGARSEAAQAPDWDGAEFEKARMDDKILMLKNYLPEFLVDNRGLYGIMSAGIHALSESQCLEAYPVVRLGIELVLDEQLDRANKAKKIASATKDIAGLHSEIKRS